MQAKTRFSSYQIALALAIAAALFLMFLIGAVGLIGEEGDRFDLLYFGVVLIGATGALLSRFQARGMAVALSITALSQFLLVLIALAIGKQHSPVSSIFELVGLNGFFIVIFASSAVLFQRAANTEKLTQG